MQSAGELRKRTLDAAFAKLSASETRILNAVQKRMTDAANNCRLTVSVCVERPDGNIAFADEIEHVVTVLELLGYRVQREWNGETFVSSATLVVSWAMPR